MQGVREQLPVGSAPHRTPSRFGSDRAGRSDHMALLLILSASFMVVLDFSIVNVALPSIEHDLGFAAGNVQWVVTAYAITFAGLLVAGGRAADLFGRRRMFVIGLVGFAVASLAAGMAQDPLLLVVARALQGVAAAVVAPAALSLITTGFPEGRERTRALGLYGATASVGFVAGQVLGGFLVEFTTWRAVFLVNVPVGLLAAVVAPRLINKNQEGDRHLRLDLVGAFLVIGATAAAVFAVSEAGVLGWTSLGVSVAIGLALLSGAGFVVVERHHRHPLVRLDLLRAANLRTAGALTFLIGLWNAGEMLVLSLYLQQTLHDSPLITGLAIAPQGIVGFVAGFFGARLSARLGIRRLLVLTGAATTIGFLMVAHLPATGSYSPVLAAVTLIGFGTAGTSFGATVTASAGMADEDQGLVGGVINTARQVGAAFGAALLLAIAEGAGGEGGVANVVGDRHAMLAGAGAGAVATLVAWRGARSAEESERDLTFTRNTGRTHATSNARP